MKSILVLILLVSSVGFAQLAPTPQPTPSLPPDAQSARQLQPIRQGKAHLVVKRFEFKSDPTGANVSSVILCTKDIDAPVYDLRTLTTSDWYYMYGMAYCDSTIGGEPVTVQINTAIALTAAAQSDSGRDQKNFNASMNVYPKAQVRDLGLYSGTTAWSNDLSLQVIGLSLRPNMNWNCPTPKPGDKTPLKCAPGLNEYFETTVEFKD